MKNILNVLKKRNFLSLFTAQFLGAFNDNVFRIFLLSFITYSLSSIENSHKEFVANIAIGLFMLPFFLFSAMAGEIADKYQKPLLIKIIKAGEIFVMALAFVGFASSNVAFLMLVLFLMGTQSAFFGPLKYSILPEILDKKEYILGNGIIEAGTFVSILLGTILGGVFASIYGGGHISIYIIAVVLIVIAGLGFGASYFMKDCSETNDDAKIEYNFIKSTIINMKFAKQSDTIFLTILGISWFWLVGAVLMSKMPSLASDVIGGNAGVFVLLLAIFSLGIGVGSMLCQLVLKGEVSAKYVPLSALLMTLFLFDLSNASFGYRGEAIDKENLKTIFMFLSDFRGFRVCFDLFMLACMGGLFVVPLNTILQAKSKEKDRSKVIATNNIINALFMVVGSIFTVVLSIFHFSIPFVIMVLAAVNLFVSFYICLILPFSLFKIFAKSILKVIYKVEVIGVENYKKYGKSVIIANHQSFLDAILLGAFLPGRPTFAINTYMAEHPFLKPLLKLVDIVPIDPTKPMATKTLVDAVNDGKTVVIFPEGRITTTGALMKIYDGVGMVVDKTKASIIPIRISGAEFSAFARFRKKLDFNPSSKITLTVLPPRKIAIDENVKGKARRLAYKNEIYNIMSSMMFETSNYNMDLFKSLINARNLFGGKYDILEDITRKTVNYDKFVMGSFVLGKQISKECKDEQNIGLMMPNLNVHLILFFGMQAYKKTPAMINFSSGLTNILSMVASAKIKTIYTLRQFVETAKLHEVI